MRKYRFVKGLTLGLFLGITGTNIYQWGEASIKPSGQVKYRLNETPPNIGIIIHHPMEAGPKLREFHCIGGAKNCGKEEESLIPSVEVFQKTPEFYFPDQPKLKQFDYNYHHRVHSIPEPTTISLLGIGLFLLWRFAK
jgi:hypothetical protein